MSIVGGSYRKTRGVRLTGLSPFWEKVFLMSDEYFYFYFFSYVKSHLNNDIWIPIYKTIPAICNTPHQTQCIQNSIFPHFIMVITQCNVLWAEFWFVVVCWCAK